MFELINWEYNLTLGFVCMIALCFALFTFGNSIKTSLTLGVYTFIILELFYLIIDLLSAGFIN